MMHPRHSAGFTLIETIIYIGLVGFIFGSALFATYNLIEGSSRLGARAIVHEEGGFVMRKIEAALRSAKTIDTSTAHQLSVTQYDGTTITIRLTGTSVELRRSGGSYTALTTENVTANDLTFTRIAPSGSGPEGVSVALVLGGDTFTAARYLRN